MGLYVEAFYTQQTHWKFIDRLYVYIQKSINTQVDIYQELQITFIIFSQPASPRLRLQVKIKGSSTSTLQLVKYRNI